jgi:Ca2+-binding RTX toxin-like protein
MTIRRLLVLTPLFCAFGAAPAEATTGCGHFDDGSLRVGTFSGADVVGVVRSGDGIVVTVNGAPITCQGTASTVRNTDTIALGDNSGDPNAFTIDLSGGAFAPGATAELGSNDEIELTVFLSGPKLETLRLRGGPGADGMRLGRSAGVGGGVNLNAGSESGAAIGTDVDLQFGGVDVVSVEGGLGDDTLDAGGGPEFTGAFGQSLRLDGAEGEDRLRGGDANDTITDGPGDDLVDMGDGNDRLFQAGDTGDDAIAGDAGVDAIVYGFPGGPGTRVDLRLTGPQATGSSSRDALSGIENITTLGGPDVVIGDDAGNILSTSDGDDVVIGGGGALDLLDGGLGTDTLSYATATEGVTVDLARGATDVLHTGGAGDDVVESFENLTGSPAADRQLAGTDGPNTISGLGGGDTVVARGGGDALEIRDGETDGAICGDGADIVIADVSGVDVLAEDCEGTLFDVRPDTEILAGPPSLTRDRTPSFGFRATKPGSTLECSLDDRPFASCRSPLALGPVIDGAHAFRVRARDALGALDLTPAASVFTVDATRPRITRLRVAAKRLRYRLSEDATVTIVTRGRIMTRRGHRGANRIALSALGIRRGHRRLRLTATDAAGNRSLTRRLAVSVRG